METSKRDLQPVINLGVIKVVFDFMKSKHPLASSIPREGVASLIKSLVSRLETSDTTLDFSPKSLRTLESLLLDYHKHMNNSFSDENTVALVREMAAYIGEVLIRNTDVKWVLLDDTIWGTRLESDGEWTLLKENKRQIVYGVSYTLADIAATGWQSILDGKPPKIYQVYRSIQRKTIKEAITYRR